MYTLFYVEACNEFVGPISASLRPGNTASFEDCRSGGDLNCRVKTSRTKTERANEKFD